MERLSMVKSKPQLGFILGLSLGLAIGPTSYPAFGQPIGENLKNCVVTQLEALKKDIQYKNLRDEARPAPDFLDQELAHAYESGTLDVSKAPGKWFEIKSGALAGRSMHYVSLGPEGKVPAKGTYVLVGGLLYHAQRWNQKGFVDALRKKGYRVVVIDPPGQGWTLLRHLVEDGSSPGFLKLPQRYEKEDQAGAIHELLSDLKEKGELSGDVHLAGESYGGWLTTYIGTLSQFQGLIKDITLLDPGMANTAHVMFGADQWSKMRETIERFNPAAAALIPEKMPGTDPYKAIKDLSDDYGAELLKHPSPLVQAQGKILQTYRDYLFKALMDNFMPPAARTTSPVRYSGAPSLFNGIREFDAIKNASSVIFPTHLIEAGSNHGIVPHLQHREFAKKNPNLVTWHRFVSTGHDLPVEAGPELAQLMTNIAEETVEPPKRRKRVDIHPKRDIQVEREASVKED
jgi:pimeloyl-ACP methyl ester carboxylesterase